jgi:hypothetical protein
MSQKYYCRSLALPGQLAELANRKLRRSAHRSVTKLDDDIREWAGE